ncbi:hypothetical protein ACRRTK_005483 [Alexandromys fortis]
MTESRLDRCRQDFKVQNRTSVSLPSTEGGAALPGGSEAQPTGPLRGKVPSTECAGGPALAAAFGLGRTEQGRVARVPSPLAAQSPRARGAPGGWGSRRNVPRLRRRASAGPGRAGALSLAAAAVLGQTDVPGAQHCPQLSSPGRARPPARPPWCRGSSPGWWWV